MSQSSWPFLRFLFLFILIAASLQCGNKTDAPAQFELLRKNATGLDFHNVLKPNSQFNALYYMYFYNGGGVAAADFNKDGLVDLYFTSNMSENKLFLNEGGLRFRDVTEQAGVSGCGPQSGRIEGDCGWSNGASVVDINNDGLPDIYVSQLGDFRTIKGRNQLYVCQGIKDGVPVYEDQAIRYGLDLVGFSTQAAFFDYDLDGDLDMFQLNHSVHANGTFGQKKSFQGTFHPLAGDKLLRNDGPPTADGKGGFKDVTQTSGINSTVIGYGLGIATGDINLDGWPDLYIGNDFHENDYLYINQHDGTFKEMLTEEIMHTSQFSMGVDIADVNNDGWSEIISLDMLPEDPYILKSSLGEDAYGIYRFKLEYGYHFQFARNTLQKNNGDGTFSEVGMFAGVHATDWSWAPLFLDFDNDGKKDLFISNGIERRMNDIDYARFRETSPVKFKQESNNLDAEDLSVVEKMPKIKLPNKFFRNNGDFKFADLEKQIKGSTPTFSNGAIYADLDNDGDLDIVVNNLEDEPFVYQNMAVEKKEPGNYLSFHLEGPPANRDAIGARVIVYKKGEKLIYENYPVRGFQSSMLIDLHVGIGDTTAVDSILVVWPDNSCQRLGALGFNQTHTLSWKSGLPAFDYAQLRRKPAPPFQFTDITGATALNYHHKENAFVEFDREKLIPFMVSTEGPALAVGDVNGDGLDDVFFGSSKKNFSALYYQKKDGTFYENTPEVMLMDSVFEDVDAVFVDLENDGDLDLVIAAGGNEYWDNAEPLKQRAYINDGKGHFQRKDFPGIFMTASCVLPADFNGDGLVDLFFGGRAVPWNYGITPNSVLLQNKGGGEFEDVTATSGGALVKAGLVRNGAWADMDADGKPDLVLALEWEPVTIFYNRGNTFEKKPINDRSGWWNFALPYDFDGDGDLDILAGNLGQNAKFKPTDQEPVRMYITDFDDNGQIDQVLTYYLKGREIPFANYDELTKTLPFIKKEFLYSKNFAKATVPEIFGKEKLHKSLVRTVNTLQSMYFENTGKGYTAHPLPDDLQLSPLWANLEADLSGNGQKDVLLGGNFFEANIEMGRYDAFYGGVLAFEKGTGMQAYPLGNLRIKGQTRRIRPIQINGKPCFIWARNNDSAVVVQLNRPVQ